MLGYTPQMWACRPPPVRPLNFPPGCGPGDPPQPDPSTFPLGVGLDACKACWDTPPLVNRMTDQCKNITLPQSSFAGGNKQMSLNGLFCRIRILILIGTANRMATFYYVELFTLYGVEFKLHINCQRQEWNQY